MHSMLHTSRSILIVTSRSSLSHLLINVVQWTLNKTFLLLFFWGRRRSHSKSFLFYWPEKVRSSQMEICILIDWSFTDGYCIHSWLFWFWSIMFSTHTFFMDSVVDIGCLTQHQYRILLELADHWNNLWPHFIEQTLEMPLLINHFCVIGEDTPTPASIFCP